MASALKEVKTEESALDELAREHGEIHVFSTRLGKVAFKSPGFADYQRFTDKITDNKGSKFAVMRELALACRVHPSREDLLAIFEKMPGMVLQAATAIQELAGTEVEGEVKKG